MSPLHLTATLGIGAVLLCAPLAAQEIESAPPTSQEKGHDLTSEQILEAVKEAIPLEVTGGTFLWHYQPLLSRAKPLSEIYWAYLRFDVDMPGDIDFHLETMFRDSKLRPFFASNVWIQEGYLDWKPWDQNYGHLKIGKVYSQFGRFWDGSFYGNVPYFDGLKLDPDIGLSYEHNMKLSGDVSADISLQYFTRDGRTNGSLQGRDTLSLAGSQQRDIVTARFAPKIQLSQDTSLTLGVSGMAFRADFAPSTDPLFRDDTVVRWNTEAALKAGPFEAFGELTWQRGTHAPLYPRPGIAEDETLYVMSGISYDFNEWFKLGYNFSMADYETSDVREVMHMPRMQFQVSKSTAIWLEYVNWEQEASGPDTRLDDSINFVLFASF